VSLVWSNTVSPARNRGQYPLNCVLPLDEYPVGSCEPCLGTWRSEHITRCSTRRAGAPGQDAGSAGGSWAAPALDAALCSGAAAAGVSVDGPLLPAHMITPRHVSGEPAEFPTEARDVGSSSVWGQWSRKFVGRWMALRSGMAAWLMYGIIAPWIPESPEAVSCSS
jgi:hypothetical protein